MTCSPEINRDVNFRIFIAVAKWLAGVVAFIAASAVTAHYFILVMQAWARAHGCSLGFVLELYLLRAPVFGICIISGALSAAALAKPAGFGGIGRIWRHLVATYAFWLLGCALFIRTEFLPLPEYPRSFELNIYLSTGFIFSAACFIIGFLAWVRMAFGMHQPTRKGNPSSWV